MTTPTKIATPQPSPDRAEPEVAPTQTPTATPTTKPLPTAQATEETPTPVEGAPEGWLTYANDIYGYEFKYPEGVVITEAPQDAFSMPVDEAASGLTVDDVYTRYTGKLCVRLEFELGYLIISAPANEGFRYVSCGRTGRGYEGPDREDTLVIDGKTCIAKGFEERGPGNTLNVHNETLVVVLDDGTRIEYGSRPVDEATYDDYLKLKPELLTIVQSYHKTA